MPLTISKREVYKGGAILTVAQYTYLSHSGD